VISRKASPVKHQSPTTETAKAVGYVRVSTQEQATEGFSLEAQVEKLVKYAAAKDFELLGIYKEEGVSGKVPLASRPQGAALVEELGRKRTMHVLVVKLDRLFRNTHDALTYANKWDQSGTALHVLDMGGDAVDTKSALGRMFFTIAAGFAEMERRIIGERVTATLNHMRLTGQVYTRIPPFGFERQNEMDENGNVVKKLLVKVPEEIETITRILRWRKNGMGYSAIARELTRLRIPTKRGGKWYPVTVSEILRMYGEEGEGTAI
jgi:site-specific DNA recombinase